MSQHLPSEVGGRAPRGHPPEDWADALAASVSGPQVINDSKTPSGTVHVGEQSFGSGAIPESELWQVKQIA